MGVYSIEGRFGSGKTAFAVWLGLRLAADRGGVPVWANFHIQGAATIRTFEDLYRCEDGVIVLDELQGTIHARKSGQNLDFLAWFDQCRKQNSDVICITQALHKIDVIVREMIEINFDCENKGDNMTKIVPMDLHAGKVRKGFLWDRSVSYALYNTRERAWRLEPEDVGVSPQSKKTRGLVSYPGRMKGAAMGP